MTHVVTFQRSASVTWLPLALLMTSPTAVHAVAELHDTENRMAPATSGVGWTAHFLPFQRSASAPEVVLPTAVHAAAELHDTPFSEPLPTGSGTGRIVQALPFHPSASGVGISLPPTGVVPTAMHALAEVQDRLLSELRSVTGGVACTVHVVPFQVAASGR